MVAEARVAVVATADGAIERRGRVRRQRNREEGECGGGIKKRASRHGGGVTGACGGGGDGDGG